MREGRKRGGWKVCGGVKMGCIMTPMPNHLSTLKPHREVWRTHLIGGDEGERDEKRCGNGRSGVVE